MHLLIIFGDKSYDFVIHGDFRTTGICDLEKVSMFWKNIKIFFFLEINNIEIAVGNIFIIFLNKK